MAILSELWHRALWRRLVRWLRSRPSGNPVRGSPERTSTTTSSRRVGGAGARGSNGDATSTAVEKGRESADIRLEQTYTIAYIAHAPLEPRAAVARWEDGKLTVWTGSQRPFGVRDELTRAFGVSTEAVRVIVPDTGAGYGGKHTGEAAVEAARLARGAGKPVRLVWTREEEFTWAYFRPSGVIEVKSSVRRDGVLSAWEFHNYNSGGSAIESPYAIPNQQSKFHAVQFPLHQGSYRGLAATANHFARESHMDELANAAGIEPLEFRLKNIKNPRLRAVLEAAAKAFDWGKKCEAGRGSGIAVGFDKGGYIATCAEVAVDPSNSRVQVIRATSAFECGAIINPDHLKNQVEGAMVMGLGVRSSKPSSSKTAGSRTRGFLVIGSRDFATRPRSKSCCSIGKTCRRPARAKRRSLRLHLQSAMRSFERPALDCARCLWCRGESLANGWSLHFVDRAIYPYLTNRKSRLLFHRWAK